MNRATALLSFGLVASLAPLMTFPATMPAIIAAWGLSTSEAGWIGGIYFAGYAAAVPLLSGATDRVNARHIYLASSLLGAASSLAFALWAETFWPGLLLRFLGGIALAGVHMPGLKLLADLLEGPEQARGTGIYASSYAFGSAGSFLFAGVVETAFGWQAAFLAAGAGPILAFAAVLPLPAPRRREGAAAPLRLAPLLRNRALMAYVVAFAGNTWEVFAIRVWFVAYLAWSLERPGAAIELPPLAVLSGLAAMAGVPVSIFVAELALRKGRAPVVTMVCWISVAVCLCLAAAVDAPVVVVILLLSLLQITSFADVGALTAGVLSAAEPERRGASLALYSCAGFVTGWLGPVAVGMIVDGFGGDAGTGWAAAFLVMALGSAVAALAMRHIGR